MCAATDQKLCARLWLHVSKIIHMIQSVKVERDEGFEYVEIEEVTVHHTGCLGSDINPENDDTTENICVIAHFHYRNYIIY